MTTASKIGKNVTIYPMVTIEDGCTILDGAVLGRLPMSTATMNRQLKSEPKELVIGEGSIIGCNSVLYTGSRLDKNVFVGDLSSIREGCHIQSGAVIGRGVMVLYNAKIGKNVRIQDQVHVVGDAVIEDHVFMGMGVVTTNDNDAYLTRFKLKELKIAVLKIRKFAFIGAQATLLPGIEIGEGAIVAAGAVVTKNVEPWTMVAGVPAKFVKPVPDAWRQLILDKVK